MDIDTDVIVSILRKVEHYTAARKEREIELLQRISERLELIESDTCEARLRARENKPDKTATVSDPAIEKIDPQIIEQLALRKADVLKQVHGQLLSIQKIVEEIATC